MSKINLTPEQLKIVREANKILADHRHANDTRTTEQKSDDARRAANFRWKGRKRRIKPTK